MYCCYCKLLIKIDEQYNFLCGKYSHEKCDLKYFKEQEKNIKYIKKSDVI